MGTIIALLVAIAVYWHLPSGGESLNLIQAGLFVVAPATVFLFVPTLAWMLASGQIQRLERELTARVYELFRRDHYLSCMRGWLFLFPLISFLGAMCLFFFPSVNHPLFIALWIVSFGVAVDALYQMVRRIYGYLDPFYVADLLHRRATASIQNEQELDLCHWSDALAEMAIKAAQRHSTALCSHICRHLQSIATLFLRALKSISHQEKDPQSAAMGIKDKVSYTLFFLLQRLEMINDKAVKQELEPVCSVIVTETGKIAISAASYDFSIMGYPVQFLGRFSVHAQHQGISEVGPKAVCTLQEVAKSVLTDLDTQYAELQEPFTTLVAQMGEISREMFRHNKSTSPKVLLQPFQELRTLFTSEKMAGHPDTPAILSVIDRMIGEFETLETVMRTLPPFTSGTGSGLPLGQS